MADCTFDMGRELDNYHGPYRYFTAEAGDLDYYFIGGPEPADVVRRYTWLTGRPLFSPKWSLGYSGSTMSYTDAPDAQSRMNEFVEKCREHDITCDSFHLSSGYTSIGAKRYVFNWDRNKFPNPESFVHSYLDHGIRLVREHQAMFAPRPSAIRRRRRQGSIHSRQEWPARNGTILG